MRHFGRSEMIPGCTNVTLRPTRMGRCLCCVACMLALSVSRLTCECICARRPCGGSTANVPKTSVSNFAVNTVWPATCWPTWKLLCRMTIRSQSYLIAGMRRPNSSYTQSGGVGGSSRKISQVHAVVLDGINRANGVRRERMNPLGRTAPRRGIGGRETFDRFIQYMFTHHTHWYVK
jgi:hypothetical protein